MELQRPLQRPFSGLCLCPLAWVAVFMSTAIILAWFLMACGAPPWMPLFLCFSLAYQAFGTLGGGLFSQCVCLPSGRSFLASLDLADTLAKHFASTEVGDHLHWCTIDLSLASFNALSLADPDKALSAFRGTAAQELLQSQFKTLQVLLASDFYCLHHPLALGCQFRLCRWAGWLRSLG